MIRESLICIAWLISLVSLLSFSEQSANEAPPPEYTISQQPVAVAVQPMAMVPQALPKSLAPHNFLALSIFVSICFGITNIATLFCSVPAIVLSLLVRISWSICKTILNAVLRLLSCSPCRRMYTMSKDSTRMASSFLTSQWVSQQVQFSMECSAFSLGSSLRDCSIPTKFFV